eukprot:12921739-Prorocentrum_lima.AAC.1
MRMKRALSIQRLSMKKKIPSMLHHINGMDEMSKAIGIFKILKVIKKRMQLMKKKATKLTRKAKGKK